MSWSLFERTLPAWDIGRDISGDVAPMGELGRCFVAILSQTRYKTQSVRKMPYRPTSAAASAPMR
jgi:hypothetical protein